MEYNTKTRIGIWFCLLLMLLVLSLVLFGIIDTAKRESLAVNGTNPDDDAVYVHANPQKTTESTSAETTRATSSSVITTTTKKPEHPLQTEATSVQTEKRALYYVTVSGGNVVLLDEYGELLETLHENAMFLPREDLAALRAGIALFSKEELAVLLDDLG